MDQALGLVKKWRDSAVPSASEGKLSRFDGMKKGNGLDLMEFLLRSGQFDTLKTCGLPLK